MDIEKQKLLISYLVNSNDLFWKVNGILDSNFFDPQLKNTVKFIREYYEQYKNSPTHQQILAETKTKIESQSELSKQELQYAETQLETFCRNKAIEKAILASPKLLEDQNFGAIEKLIKSAIQIGLQKDLGLEYFSDPEARLRAMTLNNPMIPTKFIELDESLGGGINRQELLIVAAGSGVGKSLVMANIIKNMIEQQLNCLYITLELSEQVVAKRFDSMMSGYSQIDILKNITKVSSNVKAKGDKSGKLFIKRMPESSTNVNHIKSYLKEFETINGFLPDVIAVDYLDIMASVEKVSVENVSIKDKYVTEELRALAFEYNCVMISASQLNRGGAGSDVSELSQSGIAGGFTKIFTADNVVAVQQTDVMKAAKEYLFKLLKTRSSNGVGKVFMMNIDPISLVISNKPENERKLDYVVKSSKPDNKQQNINNQEVKTNKPIDNLLKHFNA